MDIKIEKGVPIPEARRTSHIRQLAKQMQVGDSVVVPTVEAGNSLYSHLRSIGHKSTSRKLSDGTYRLWRIK